MTSSQDAIPGEGMDVNRFSNGAAHIWDQGRPLSAYVLPPGVTALLGPAGEAEDDGIWTWRVSVPAAYRVTDHVINHGVATDFPAALDAAGRALAAEREFYDRYIAVLPPLPPSAFVADDGTRY
jgi:hypothetical protein